ncbi:GrpB family protein [Virgibacillus sp. SK37]|uniref:GrpB family protein n=1 Tax=Virgibacillus sp. SK37 TaxID=403957 RepID=UPI0004D0C04B|nr:GrpB family protein [Virgibacillus sp. SK37]AIF42907.1 hypothetical protein X953_06590 [Virgibacillus sp. SK37]
MKIEVKEHNEKWERMFKEEAQRIKVIFGDELIDIHHIGSTSVNGLKAKPIIDIMPVVKHIGKIDLLNGQMAGIGYESLGENGIKGRRFFRKGGDNRTHHIHVFQVDNEGDIDRHLAVRDYLRTHCEDAKRYGHLKENLAKQFPSDIDSYAVGKDAFVKELEEKAVHWYKDR